MRTALLRESARSRHDCEAARGGGVPARTCQRIALIVAFLCGAIFPRAGHTEPTAEQMQNLKAADSALRDAAANYRKRNFKEAGQYVKQAQSLIAGVNGVQGLDRRLESLRVRLRRAHSLLEIEGISLPPLQAPASEPGQQTERKSQSNSRQPPQKAEAPRPMLEVQRASGAESVLFSRDIATIFVENCFDCHAAGRRDAGRLSLETLAGILRGGQSGLALKPGDAADSLIVKKLRGTSGARMPLDRDPLPEAQIAAIEKWISEGAKYDAADANQSLELVAAATRAKSATHEQLSADRAISAQRSWRMAIPDEQPDTHQTKHFLLVGNIGKEPLEALGKVAEDQALVVVKMLRLPDNQPLVKGRMTLFAFKRRSDYSEWRNVDGRELPAAWRGHWKYTTIDAYACLVPPSGSEYSLSPLVAQQVAAVAIASLGRVPDWFADGAGHVIASRVDPRDERVRRWESQLAQLASRPWSAGDFLAGKLPPEEQSLLNYALVKAIAANPQKLQGVLTHLRKGVEFEQAFARVFGATPQATVAAWSGRPATASPPVRRR